MRLGKHAAAPSCRVVDLDLTKSTQVAAYCSHTESLLPTLPRADTPEDVFAALRSLCLESSAWVQEQGQRKSPAALALKAQLVALTTISGHLHNYRGHIPWHSQDRMNLALPGIISTWERTVRRLTWPSPMEAHFWLDCSGFPPSF